MAAILLTGAASQGKTAEVIDLVKKSIHRNPFGKIWILLPTDLQIGGFRARLLDELNGEAYFGIEFFDFYSLYARILEIIGIPQRRIKDTGRFRILRHVLGENDSQLRHFHRIAQMPGFIALVAAFIQELKQARITPEAFEQAIKTPKDQDLWLIYRAYQDFLRQRDLVDGEGEGWLALARLESDDASTLELGVELLIVDGYDQFNPVQAQLLAQIVKRVDNVCLALTYQPERAETAHRRFAQTRDQLFAAMQTAGSQLDEKVVSRPRANPRQPSLEYLSGKLFDTHPQRIDNDGGLILIEAPDRRREVRTVLRAVKRLLLSGVNPDEIAIVARNLQPYMPYFMEAAPAYELPLTNRRGSPLKENPAIAAFLSLIGLPEQDFPRRATIDTLRSPYLKSPDLTPEQTDMLDRISRARLVISGRRDWLQAIETSSRMATGDETDEGELPPGALTPDETNALRDGLEGFFTRINPPAQATARAYIRWLEDLIGPDVHNLDEGDESDIELPDAHFNVVGCIRAGAEPEIVTRDLVALDCLKRIFRDVLAAYELIDAWTPIPWEFLRLDLRIAVDNAIIHVPPNSHRLGRVLLASIFEARGLPHDHIFLIGLSEGEFPAHAPEDALYIDSERQEMQAAGLPLLTSMEAADESSLFYEITALAQRHLTLLRPYIDDKGNEWPASPYWRAVLSLIDASPERIPIAARMTLDEAACLPDAVVALAHALNDEPDSAAWGVHRWLLAQPETAARWANVQRNRQIETRRTSRHDPHDAYTGRLTDSTLLDMVREELGPARIWSASQFNEYGKCPFQFFAKRLLQLEAIKEPEEGLDRLQLGSLMHEILEHTYKQIAAERLDIIVENQARALDILDETFDQKMVDAPERYGFRVSAAWNQEQDGLRRKLRALVAADFSEASPVSALLPGVRRAYLQEVAFSTDRTHALDLRDADGVPIRVRGVIDRVDIADGQVVVIDYKSGSTKFSSDDMTQGYNLQMLLYMRAARQTGQEVVGGAFWHIPTNELSGTVKAADQEQLDTAYQALLDNIEAGRQGVFVSAPSKMDGNNCGHPCDFRRLCRVDRASKHKQVD